MSICNLACIGLINKDNFKGRVQQENLTFLKLDP